MDLYRDLFMSMERYLVVVAMVAWLSGFVTCLAMGL
jgi:hypothetical protein